jgi:hypothetical protein
MSTAAIAARIASIEARLTLYKQAETAVLESSQSWSSPDGMVYSRGNLYHLQREIRNMEMELAYLRGEGFISEPIVFGGPAR